MTTHVSALKRLACGFSGVLVGAGILAGISAVVALLFGVFWVLFHIPTHIWYGIVALLAFGASVGVAVLLIKCIPNVSLFWQDLKEIWQYRKERLAREAEKKAARKARTAELPPAPKAPSVPFRVRWQRFVWALSAMGREIRADLASIQIPPIRKVLMVSGILAAELGLLYALSVLNLNTFVPTEKFPNPGPIGVQMFGFFCAQFIITLFAVCVWYELDERYLPTLFQRVSAAASSAFIPLFAWVGTDVYLGTGVPEWVAALIGLPLGAAIMAFILGFVYTCEENLFDMWKNRNSPGTAP